MSDQTILPWVLVILTGIFAYLAASERTSSTGGAFFLALCLGMAAGAVVSAVIVGAR